MKIIATIQVELESRLDNPTKETMIDNLQTFVKIENLGISLNNTLLRNFKVVKTEVKE